MKRVARSRKPEVRSSGRNAGVLKRVFLRLHHDNRGAIAVLVLLTLWCLLAIVGLIWNTMETATRRERIQTAADSASHAAATWMARTHNAVTAQNMVISQDASAEIIWRAVPTTDLAIDQRLKQELALAAQMKTQQNLQALQGRLQAQLRAIATEYDLANIALQNIESGTGANFANPTETRDFQHTVHGARSAMEWVNNTYVNGAAPPVGGGLNAPPQRPGPPGPNGEGLAQVMAAWKPVQNEDVILDYIINFINTQETPIFEAYLARTVGARMQPVDAIMASHRAAVYQAELQLVNDLPQIIEAQRAQLALFYKTDITLATLKNNQGSTPAAVTAALVPASYAPSVPHVDSIRMMFPLQAMQANLSPAITIDAISPHTGDARIWHPDVPAAIPAGTLGVAGTVMISANFPDGWGHNWATPLEHYIRQRVANDMRELNNSYMVPLDDSRSKTLADAVRVMMGLPPSGNMNIAALPGTLPDDEPRPWTPPATLPGEPPPIPPPPTFDNVPVLPRLTAPLNSTAAFRTHVDLYNQHGGGFTGAVRNLRDTLISYTAYFERFTQRFAADTWHTNVNIAAQTVLEMLGQSKQFMVLQTYGLRQIPDWAKPGMFASAQASIENHIVQINIQNVADAIARAMAGSDPRGAAYLDNTFRNTLLFGMNIGQATAIADRIVRPVAHQIAINIAAEWINRPWPFEIEPPAAPVPPFRGILPDDRKLHFTVLAGARETPETAPKLIQLRFNNSDVFSSQQTKLVGYAQAEAFNWMEFNDGYGGGERFDQIVRIPEITYRTRSISYTGFLGSPRAWRVNSIGGWNWRSRLSLSDALYPALELNPELRQYLKDAGVSAYNEGALNEANLH